VYAILYRLLLMAIEHQVMEKLSASARKLKLNREQNAFARNRLAGTSRLFPPFLSQPGPRCPCVAVRGLFK
jgi:hypothetical protein